MEQKQVCRNISVCSASGIRLNFSVHFVQRCFYFADLVCVKFDSELGFAVCQGKPEIARCCWLPSSFPVGCRVSVLRGGVLCVRE